MIQTIQIQDEGKRLDTFLYEILLNEGFTKLTRTLVQKYMDKGCSVNGKSEKKSYKLRVDDFVEIPVQYWEKIEGSVDLSEDIQPEEGELDIRYEDTDLMVIYKPKGIIVHPGVGNTSGTIANFVRDYLEKKGEYDPMVDRCGIVHRLDRGVSGLMVIAKRKESQEYLKSQFQERKVVKIYHAFVEKYKESGVPSFEEFEQVVEIKEVLENMDISFEPWKKWYEVRGYIGRSTKNKYKMEFRPYEFSGSKFAQSYILLNTNEALIKIETGRMHQIRASLEYLGFHIQGDNLYGRSSSNVVSNNIELESVLLSFKDMKGNTLIFKI